MKIRIAMLDSDKDYLERISSCFVKKYKQDIELLISTDPFSISRFYKVDMYVISYEYVGMIEIPNGMPTLVLVDKSGISEYKCYPAICKYQMSDNIYKSIVEFFSTESSFNFSFGISNSDCTTILFTGAAGGVGTTTAAVAYAMHLSSRGKKVFFIDLNTISDLPIYLTGSGANNFSEVVFALKYKKNVSMRLKTLIKEDVSGVHFFDAADNITDMTELSIEDVLQLIQEIKNFGEYDVIVVDAKTDFDGWVLHLMKEVSKIVLVSDGTKGGNLKTYRFMQAINKRESISKDNLVSKTSVLYNKVSSKQGEVMDRLDLPVVAGFNRIADAQPRQIAEQLGARNDWSL